jgi:GT2 family glycosyltransferase
MKNHISIIIVNYNTPQETKDCLRSLDDLEVWGFDYQIIVVDNGSKEPLKLSTNFLRHHSHIELITSASNLGFTGGNNLGIKHAANHYDSDYFLLLNSDTVVTKDFLKEMYLMAKNDPKIGLMSPKIYFYKGYEYHAASYSPEQLGKVIWYAGGKVDWLNLISFHLGVDEVDRGHFDEPHQTDFATGCCMLISREVVERIGTLDNRFFLYSEDVDYSLRVKRAGLKVYYCPNASIYHKIASSTGGVGSQLQQYYQTRNRLLLSLKHGWKRRRLTAIHLALRLLTKGSASERKAVLDLLKSKLGKQHYV